MNNPVLAVRGRFVMGQMVLALTVRERTIQGERSGDNSTSGEQSMASGPGRTVQGERSGDNNTSGEQSLASGPGRMVR